MHDINKERALQVTHSIFIQLSAAVYSLDIILRNYCNWLTRNVLKDENVKKYIIT